MPIFLYTDDAVFESQAEALCDELGFELTKSQVDGYCLKLSSDGLSLLSPKKSGYGPIRCEFVTGGSAHRRQYGGGKSQAIAKAVGLEKQFLPRVLDLNAGLGGDAFVLASLGCSLTMVERNPVVYALLRDGLQRLSEFSKEDSELSQISGRLNLLCHDGLGYLESMNDNSCAEVIYLDPMFPARDKSAKVKKEMQVFHEIVGADEDADALLEPALYRAQYRVVVKRSARAGFLSDRKPTFSLQGKSTRFDIYALKRRPENNA